jgi:hypothetical protein
LWFSRKPFSHLAVFRVCELMAERRHAGRLLS